MTNKESIKLIQGIEEDGRNITTEHVEALDLAIKALEERAKGEWIINELASEGQCSLCKARARLIFGVNYCPHCGARMWKETKND